MESVSESGCSPGAASSACVCSFSNSGVIAGCKDNKISLSDNTEATLCKNTLT